MTPWKFYGYIMYMASVVNKEAVSVSVNVCVSPVTRTSELLEEKEVLVLRTFYVEAVVT